MHSSECQRSLDHPGDRDFEVTRVIVIRHMPYGPRKHIQNETPLFHRRFTRPDPYGARINRYALFSHSFSHTLLKKKTLFNLFHNEISVITRRTSLLKLA